MSDDGENIRFRAENKTQLSIAFPVNGKHGRIIWTSQHGVSKRHGNHHPQHLYLYFLYRLVNKVENKRKLDNRHNNSATSQINRSIRLRDINPKRRLIKSDDKNLEVKKNGKQPTIKSELDNLMGRYSHR